MNNMRFMDKLLDGVEVEWRGLGEVLFRTNPHALAGTTKNETLEKFKKWS